jgi:DNA topoisomerase-2
LPIILINGACGIGTGFSTDIPCFNPDDIKDRLLRLVEDEDSDIEELTPWYKGFTGSIKKAEENKWTAHGIYTIKANVITVTELPVGTWTEDYKTFLDKLETENTIYGYKNMSTETNVHFEIKMPLETVYEWKDNREIEKKLKLVSHISAKNMYVFNEKNEIVKMESPEEIIYHFWRIRNEYYIKRKDNLVNKLKTELDIITAKINFVNDVIDENIKVFRQKLNYINKQLEDKKYIKLENSYTYLTDMKIHTFSEDTIEKLMKKQKDTQEAYTKISSYKLRDFWMDDIN